MKAEHLFIIALEATTVNLANRKVDQDLSKEYLEQLHEGSVRKFESIMKIVENLAIQGYGSVTIKLDATSDAFHAKESESRFYSETEVVNMLKSEGFELELYEDFYDAHSFILSWNLGNRMLPHYDELIEMDI